MCNYKLISLLIAAFLVVFAPIAVDAISLHQDPDDFQDGSTEGWSAGGGNARPPIPPTNVPDGGPLGNGDNYLEITAAAGYIGGMHFPGRALVAQNFNKWAGDWTDASVGYNNAAVDHIEMDLKNFSPSSPTDPNYNANAQSLVIRLVIFGSGGQTFCTSGISVSTAEGWKHVSFSVQPASLIAVGGTSGDDATKTLTLKNVTGIRLMHATAPAYQGDTVDPARLGVDNITALPFELTVNTVGTGSVALNPSDGLYTRDTDVSLTATAGTGWQFSNWSGDLTGSTNPDTITMDSSKNVTANFSPLNYGLFRTIQGSGTVTLSPPGGNYQYNTQVTLTAVPNQYWEFSSWGGDLSGSDNPTTIVMDSDKNITAVFSLKDSDGDGITDQDEASGPNGGDGNNDNIPDSQQGNVVPLKSYDGQHDIVLESPVGTTLSGCRSVDPYQFADRPSWINFQFGFFEFTIHGVAIGGAATVTLYLPVGAAPNTYYRYGPTPDDNTDHWYNFNYEAMRQTGAQFNGNVVTLDFIDGDYGDDDLTADGTIMDQGGPGVGIGGTTTSGGPSGVGVTGGGSSSSIGGCFVDSLAR